MLAPQGYAIEPIDIGRAGHQGVGLGGRCAYKRPDIHYIVEILTRRLALAPLNMRLVCAFVTLLSTEYRRVQESAVRRRIQDVDAFARLGLRNVAVVSAPEIVVRAAPVRELHPDPCRINTMTAKVGEMHDIGRGISGGGR